MFCLLVVLVKFLYLPGDWLESDSLGSLTMVRDRLQKAQGEDDDIISWFILLCHCSIV